MIYLHPATKTTSRRRGFCPSTPVHESKCGIGQNGGYIRAVARIADNDFAPARRGGGAIHDIAYISLP